MSKKTIHAVEKAAVVLGVLVIPLMYSFFYLNAFWDPYEQLDQVPVAVVNLDEGAVIDGEARNLGYEIADNLIEEKSMDFILTDEKTAAEGVKGRKFYASITIPEDFTARVATASQDTEKLHGCIIYQANQKKNYLASQILETAMPTIKETVNAEIDEQIVATLTDNVAGVPASLDELKGGLDQLDAGAEALSNGTAKTSAGAAKLDRGMGQLSGSVPALKQGVTALDQGSGALDQGLATLTAQDPALTQGTAAVQQGSAQLKSGLANYTGGVNKASQGAGQLVAGLDQYTSGVTKAEQGAEALNQGIHKAAGGVDQMVSKVAAADQQMQQAASDEKLDALAGGASNVANGLASFESSYDQALALLNAAQQSGDPEQMQQAVAAFNSLGDQLPALSNGASQVSSGVQGMTGSVKQVRDNTGELLAGLQQVQAGFGSDSDAATLKGGAVALQQGLQDLASNNTALTSGADSLQSGLSTLDANSAALTEGAGSLAQGSKQLSDGVNAYTQGVEQAGLGAAKLHDGTSALAANAPALVKGARELSEGTAALAEGDAKIHAGAAQLKAGIDTADKGVADGIAASKAQLGVLTGLASFAGEPVETETQHIQPVANYGSAFAPYFMGLSLWVGGLMIYFGIYLDYHRKIVSLSKDSPRVIYRTFLFGLLSAAQGILLGLIIQFGLHISVAHPALLYGACILTALAFMSIIQLCIVNLGDIGKFLSLLLLILQLTSCGGTFPLEMQSAFFRGISPFLPMTYSTQLFKEALAGTVGANALHSALMLVGFLAVFLLLTLVLSHKELTQDVERIEKEARQRLQHDHAAA